MLLLLIGVIASPAAGKTIPASTNDLIDREIRYYLPDAGEVWILWGADGWQALPKEMWPTGTVTQEDGMMLTPMHNDGSYFTVMLQVPYQATIDYGFIVTRSYDGTVIGEIWEGDFESINAVESGVTEIYSLLTLPLDPLAAFVADLRFRGGAVLKLTAGFLLALGLVAGIAARPKRSLFRRLPQINRNLLELVLVIIGFKIVLIIVVYLVLVVFNPTNPLYIKF